MFTLLDREGYETQCESRMGWVANDRIVIEACKDDESSVGIRYLYVNTKNRSVWQSSLTVEI